MVRVPWREALEARQLRLTPLIRFELLYGARSGAGFDELADFLSLLPPVPLSPSILGAAEAAMRALAHKSAGAHRIPFADYCAAAAAEAIGGGVLHYDRDYDKLAEVLEFESIWLTQPGSLP